MPNLPSGTITFLFTDIEGSTKRWEQQPEAMRVALARHDAILRSAIEENGGYVFKTVGDAFCAAFPTARNALLATIAAQQALHNADWSAVGGIKARMALHTGVTEEREGDYFGPPVNRVARLLSAGHGGQVLLSLAAERLTHDVLPPGVSLRDLGEHLLKDLQRPECIYQLVIPDLPAEFPQLNTLGARPNNLPLQTTLFIGREREVAKVEELIRRTDVRLLTLTGPGGTGKTRLGLQVAADLADEFAEGVFFFPLAPVYDPEMVATAMGQCLGVKETENQSMIEGLKVYLDGKQILLMLDNFEQVTAAAHLLSDLLAACPRLKLMVTSRETLHLYGEKEFAVPPLSQPDIKRLPPLDDLGQYEAIRLFVERAQAAKSDFVLTAENAQAVAQICRRLDGLPLAIELAAARIRLLPAQAMLARLESRLKLLTGGAKDLPARQQTLRGAIEWSYDLLKENDRTLFRRLAVFVGGCTFEAMETVCNLDGNMGMEVLDEMESLVSKSLLRQEEQADGEPRLVMLETIREYAQERLQETGETDALQRQHANYYLAMVEEAEPQLVGSRQGWWLERLETEHDNLRAALRWAVERGDADLGLRLGGALSRFWLVRSYLTEGRHHLAEILAIAGAEVNNHLNEAHSSAMAGAEVQGYIAEGLQQLSQVLALPGGDSESDAPAARAKALNGAGNLSHRQGDYDSARALYDESLNIRRRLGDKQGISASLNNLASVAYRQGDYDAARALYEESLAIKRQLGDKQGIAASLNNLGIITHQQGDYDAARTLYEEGLVIKRQLGDRQGVAISLHGLGNIACALGDYGSAKTLLEESRAIRAELSDRQGIAYVLHDLGNVAFDLKDYARARTQYAESLAIKKQLGDKQGIAASLEGFARLAGSVGQAERVVRLCGAAASLRVAMGTPLPAIDQALLNKWLEVARNELGKVADTMWETGQVMPIDEAIAYALLQ